MNLEKLRWSDVWFGMDVPFDIYDKNGILLLSCGHIIANRDLLRRNFERGMYADADELNAARNPHSSKLKERRLDQKFESVSASTFDLVRGMRSDLGMLLLDPMEDPPLSGGVRANLTTLLIGPATRASFQPAVLDIASEIQRICQSDSDAAIASIMLDHTAHYSIRHSINTAILTELILRRIDQDDARRLPALSAALTMNIAMIRLQEVLYHQAGPLTAEQKAAINAHPVAGAERLRAKGVTDEIWLRAVVEHHEQLDGKGYPYRLVNAQLVRESQVITIAERYCSMVSARGYRRAMLPNQVLKKLFIQSESLNPSLVELLVREVGIYPPGSYVRLVHGEVAIVLRRTGKAHQPLVRLLVDAQGQRLAEALTSDTSDSTFPIAAAVAPAEVCVEHDPIQLCTLPF